MHKGNKSVKIDSRSEKYSAELVLDYIPLQNLPVQAFFMDHTIAIAH